MLDNQQCNIEVSKEYEKIRVRLSQLRNITGVTQKLVFTECHILQPNYVEYEAGTKKIPLTALIKICAFYRISLSEFFDYDSIPLMENK